MITNISQLILSPYGEDKSVIFYEKKVEDTYHFQNPVRLTYFATRDDAGTYMFSQNLYHAKIRDGCIYLPIEGQGQLIAPLNCDIKLVPYSEAGKILFRSNKTEEN